MADKIIVTVGGQVRGTNQQTALGFTADEGSITQSWGLQPGFAVVSWVKAADDGGVILPLAAMTIEIGGRTFYGVCENAVSVNSHDGRSVTQQFNDSRVLLQYDWIYGAFNKRVSRFVNGRWTHQYRHLLPGDFNAHRYTYTNSPYTGREILDFCFGSVTVESPWTRVYHTALNTPVLDVDAYGGKPLGTLVAEVSARCGATFTLGNTRYQLVWAVRGVGLVPEFPANSTERRTGLALTENPTRVRVLGDRNLYQVMNVPMDRDWLPAWEAFYDISVLADDLYQNERLEAAIGGVPAGTAYNGIPGDTGKLVGRSLAMARALTISVSEYAALRDARSAGSGEAFRDYRRAFGQSRMQLPAATYIQQLLFRAFRPGAYFFYNAQNVLVDVRDLELTGQALTEIVHDPVSGVMTALGGEQRMVGNGYAVAQGYQVGADAFATLRPGYFDLTKWNSAQSVWQSVPFQIDDSGESGGFILFNDPVIKTSDLISEVTISGTVQGYPALKAGATVSVPDVRASLTFQGERFSVVRGSGTRDACENVAGLSAFYVVTYGTRGELAFADGRTATDVAEDVAATLLNRQFVVLSGGYRVQGSNATLLTGVLGRTTISLSAGAGLEERVDYSTERDRAVDGAGRVTVEADRNFERVAQLLPLAPGERENRIAAEQLRVRASALRQNPKFAKFLVDTFSGLMGLDNPPETFHLEGGDGTALAAGTPLWCDSEAGAGNSPVNPWMPRATEGAAARVSQPVFKGVTVLAGESSSGYVRATRTGGGNVILARVKGPVSFNAPVGLPKDATDATLGVTLDHLVASPHTEAGTALDAVPNGVTAYIRVKVGGVGGGTTEAGMRYRGVWTATPSSPYMVQDVVVLQGGAASGTYVSVQDDNANMPDTGLGWVQIAPSSAIGKWY